MDRSETDKSLPGSWYSGEEHEVASAGANGSVDHIADLRDSRVGLVTVMIHTA